MNDHDLERRLRSETGPREDGYRAVPLPDDPGSQSGAPRRSRMLQAGLVLATVGAGVLAVAAANALLTPGTPNSGVGQGTATPTPVPSTGPVTPTACQPADLVLTAEPWGGAAGSRGTVVTIRLADGRYPCFFADEPGAQLMTGDEVVVAIDGLNARSSAFNQGDQRTVAVSWSNWCGREITGPVTLALRSGGVAFPVDVPEGADPVPPCNGETRQSVLNVSVLTGS